jgi:amino acid adenylation domain-containing protein
MLARTIVLDHAKPGVGAEVPGAHASPFFPCSQAQQRFWFEEQLHPGNPGLNVAVRWRLEGLVDTRDLEQAWNVLLARHATLRTSFTTVEGEVLQFVAPHAELSIPVVDLTGLTEAAALVAADEAAEREARTPFDLTRAPLIRVTRLNVRDQVTVLLVTAHHTICDGWSVGILAREMGELFAASAAGRPASLPALPLAYGQYATLQRDWLASASLEDEIELLRRSLARFKQFEVMPDRSRPPVQTSAGNIASILLQGSDAAGLAGLARANGATLFMTALAVLFAALHRYTGEDDIWIGSQIVGRDQVELEDLVGCFINTVALRGDIAGNPTFLELLNRTRDAVLEAFEVRHVPLERLIEIVNPKRDLSRNALFSVNFIFQRSFIKNEKYGSFNLVDMPSRSAGSLYDLNFFMVERPEGWRFSCEYNTDIFDDGTIAGLLERFRILLHAIIADPSQTVAHLPLLSEADRRLLLVESNRTAAAYPADRTLPQLFEEQVLRTPHATALLCGTATMTYAELDAASNRLARELQARGVAPAARVGIFLDRGADLIVALLATLKAGSAYIPLDPAYPVERIAYIAENSNLAATITRTSLRDRLPGGAPLVLVDADAASISSRASGTLEAAASPDDVAYVIYTSGSTGLPKGVQIQHCALVNFLWSMRERPGLASHDTLAAVTTISFDIAALELYLPLIVGAKLVIATNEDATDGAALLQLLRRSEATVLQATPVTWQLLLESGWRGVPKLKMLCGGEAVSRELATRLLEMGTDLWNMYGPTETTVWSSVLRIESSDGPVPIGPPIANTQFYVLDAAGELVPPGVPGELYIGGDGVALGYLGNAELTGARFVPDVFRNAPNARLYRTGDLVRRRECGELEFLGRTDHQIKLRGFRIELGEIESALLRQPGVAEAVAVAGEDALGEKTLCAYVARGSSAETADDLWTAELRARLGEFLPSYMVPSPIVVLPSLPRTPNGKIDRRALPVERSRTFGEADDAPRTSTESRLSELIGTFLGCDRIGRDRDIFTLGFHSLLAVRLTTRIAQTFGIKVPLRALFDYPTIAALAHRIDSPPEADETSAAHAIVTLNPEGTRAPFIFLHGDLYAGGLYCRRVAAAVGPARPFRAVAPHGTCDLPLLPTIEAMAADYLARVRAIQPEGPYLLGGFCVSGLIAYELARLLQAEGHAVDDVVLINASALPERSIAPFDWIVRKVGLDARLSPRLRDNICYNVARLHGAILGGPNGILRYLRGRLREWSQRGRQNAATAADPSPFPKRRGTRETENSFAHLVAALTYHPKPYNGNVTLIWGIDQVAERDDPTFGWNQLARRVRVVPIIGGHLSPLRSRLDEFGDALAELLRPQTGVAP